ncbi:hypothetical protein SLA2020_078920 [Shorea laevis]
MVEPTISLSKARNYNSDFATPVHTHDIVLEAWLGLVRRQALCNPEAELPPWNQFPERRKVPLYIRLLS